MKSAAVNIGDSILASQYNNLREDAKGAAHLLAHQQTTPDLTLFVEAGIYYLKGTRVVFAGGNSPSFTAPTTNPRIDLLVIDSAGTLSRVVGTEAASPSVPTYPKDKIVICEVFNRVGQTTIRDTDVAGQGYIQRDVRGFLNNPVAISQTGAEIYAADGGSTDDYAVTLDPAPSAYTTGLVVNFKANTANTGAATLNVNALGAKSIKKNFNQDLATGDIKAGQLVSVIYDGTNFQMISATPAAGEGVDISFTAGENITAGDKVGISANDSVKRAFKWLFTALGAESIFDAAATDDIAVAQIDTDKFVVVYNTASDVVCKIATVSGTTITWGSATVVFAAATGGLLIDVCKLDTNKFVAVYSNASGAQRLRAATVSGTTPTFGTEATFSLTTGASTVLRCCQIATDKFATFSGGASDAGLIGIHTVSGTAISVQAWGSQTGAGFGSPPSGSQLNFALAMMDTDKAVLAGRDATDNDGYVRVFTVSGTTPTLGTKTAFNVADTSNIDVVCPSQTNLVVAYRDEGDTNKGNVIAATVSGTTPTFGTEQNFDAGAVDYVAVTAPTRGTVFVSYRVSTTGKVKSATVSGNAVSAIGTEMNQTFNAADTTFIDIVKTNSTGDGVIVYRDVGNSNQGTGIIIDGSIGAQNFIGIAQETVTATNPVKVRTKGLDTNQSGLTFGTKYWVDDNALTTVDLGLDQFVGYAKSATAIVIK